MENGLKLFSYGKIAKAPDIDPVLKKRVRKLLILFREDEHIGNLFQQARKKGYVELPSVHSNHLAKCSFSIYSADKNFLRFVDRNGKIFYIVQNPRYFLHSIYLPDENIIFSNAAGRSQIMPMLRSFHRDLSNVDELELIESRRNFLGVINAYPRPYHYFRDKITTLLFLEEYLANMPILTVQNQAFLDADLINNGPEYRITGSLNSYVMQHQGFALDPAGPLSPTYRNNMQFAAASIRSKVCGKYENSELAELLDKQTPIIWFGICSQKRVWLNQNSTIATIIDSIIEEYPDALFIFDGLTAPVGVNEEEYKNTVAADEVRNLENILAKVKYSDRVKYVSLVGAHADKKIFAGNKVDYFLSSALTDSIWVAHFNRKRGLAYLATVANSDEHSHPKTFIVPEEYVQDEENVESKNWSAVNYRVDSDFLCWSVLNGLSQWMEQKKLGDKLYPLSTIDAGSSVSMTALDVCGTRLEVDFAEEHSALYSVGDEAKSYHRSAKAYRCLSGRYDFVVDTEIKETAELRIMIVGYGSGNRAEQFQLDFRGGEVTFSEGTDRFRVFVQISGKGIIDFYGFRAQPIYPGKGVRDAK